MSDPIASQHFLVEIGTEELPPTSLKPLIDAFAAGIEQRLTEQQLQFGAVLSYATPRRLAVLVEDLWVSTPRKEIKHWGPPAKIAFDGAGRPSKAALAFASKHSLSVDQLTTANDGKVDKLLYVAEAGGEPTHTLLADIVEQSLAALPIKKRMRWGSSRAEFVRPVHWVVMLFGERLIDAELFGLSSGNRTRGHRFHANRELVLAKPEDYAKVLKAQGRVLADFTERRSVIAQQVAEQAAAHGGQAVIDDDLLDEVTALVEWPVALAGNFDPAFLDVPSQALISSMKVHQKYFHVVDEENNLLPVFVTVANIESADPAQVIRGNERVIRPRLADAAFFFANDKKTTLLARRETLKGVVFQAKLGSIYDKTKRIEALAVYLAKKLNADHDLAKRAAQLCKSDLVSAMVYEFPEMQGVAGYYYALNDGEDQQLAAAISEHYMPRFAGDALATTIVGAIVALADRIDTITGIFGLGQKPSGSKDPFALRRASLGALRILVEKGFGLDLRDIIKKSASLYSALPASDNLVDDVLAYMLERFKAWYEEAQLAPEVFQAVSAKQLSHPLDINNRVLAVAAFASLPEAKALAAANKRVANILAKQDKETSGEVKPQLLSLDAEKHLAAQLTEVGEAVAPMFANRDYKRALSALACLREPVDTFFDEVMVMTDDEDVKKNRLRLLQNLRALFLQVADISYLDVKVN